MSEIQAKPKVLVADDERVIADTLSIILNQSGFEATAVYSGEKAVETAKTLKPDMLISDVIMTDMNGIDAAIKIRGMLPTCKILLFSGQAATADLLDRAPHPRARVRDPGQASPPAGPVGTAAELNKLIKPFCHLDRSEAQWRDPLYQRCKQTADPFDKLRAGSSLRFRMTGGTLIGASLKNFREAEMCGESFGVAFP